MNETLQEFIEAHTGVVVVQLTESFVEASQEMASVVTEVREWRSDVTIVPVDLSLHRDWARGHGVHGLPCTLVFQKGRLVGKARGRFGVSRLRRLFEEAGLLPGA
jgi:hypothetical protein